jgi:SpoVK/Ycf46/Vps4 family AAA+-type ATPase
MDIKLQKTKHPNLKDHQLRYDNLVGLDQQKEDLLMTLEMILDKDRLTKWEKKHHKPKLGIIAQGLRLNPLVILSGEVGCGKTELAQTVATPLSTALDKPIYTLQTPSDIRGNGMVGDLSSRITETFKSAKSDIGKDFGILIIDEGDDLATSRSETQSHHEDKAGVNVLIKEIDLIEREKTCLHLEFHRPEETELKLIFGQILRGVDFTQPELEKLVAYALNKKIPYSYSDLLQRVAKRALLLAISHDVPYSISLVSDILHKTEPTPLIID